jgi:hypothetical protein
MKMNQCGGITSYCLLRQKFVVEMTDAVKQYRVLN